MKLNKNTYIIASIALLLGSSLFFSCKKNPSAPPIQAVATGPSITIQQLRNMYANINIKFTSNTILNAVVTCDESSGNLYKQVYIRDNSGAFAATHNYAAICIHFLHSTQGFLNVGDSIAINLNGSTLDKSSGASLEIDSVSAIDQIVHLKSGLNPQPLTATLPQLNTYSNATGGGFIYDGHLVQLNNVEFIQQNVGTTYAIAQQAPAAPQNVNKYISDFIGNTMVAYNSGYANFASNQIPNNSGSIIAVANVYTTMQLTLRSYLNGDINLTSAYNPIVYDTITQKFNCEALSSKSAIMAAGWKSLAYQGVLEWQGAQFGAPPNWGYAPSASNYKSPDFRNDMWLISPPISDYAYTHGGTITKYIDFSSAIQYPTNYKLLSVLVSRSFDGTNLIPSQWTDISSGSSAPFNRVNQSSAPPNFQYAHSIAYGSVFSPAHVPITVGTPASTPTFYLAFRYQASNNLSYPDSSGSSYFIGTLFLKNN